MVLTTEKNKAFARLTVVLSRSKLGETPRQCQTNDFTRLEDMSSILLRPVDVGLEAEWHWTPGAKAVQKRRRRW